MLGALDRGVFDVFVNRWEGPQLPYLIIAHSPALTGGKADTYHTIPYYRTFAAAIAYYCTLTRIHRWAGRHLKPRDVEERPVYVLFGPWLQLFRLIGR